MNSATQDIGQTELGRGQGGPMRPSRMVWEKFGSCLPSGQWQFRSVQPGQYPYFGLCGLTNAHISVCSVWPISIFRSVHSGQYPNCGMLVLANIQISVCSVWPIPIFRSVWSGQNPHFGQNPPKPKRWVLARLYRLCPDRIALGQTIGQIQPTETCALTLSQKIISSWLKKPSFEIFLYFLVVFLSFLLIRAGDRLRRS